MFLISSAAFIQSEFMAEVGQLPPSFLPICNKRLFELQHKEICKIDPDRVFLSLPNSFEIEPKDLALLSEISIEVLFNQEGLSIGESILQCLNFCAPDEPVRILYGDTLITDIPKGLDLVAITDTNDNYIWHVESSDFGTKKVWAGYFSFSSKSNLIQYLEQNNYDFINAVSSMIISEEVERVSILNWLDLGHINTYFQARSKLTTERNFNTLSIDKNVVTKSSSDTQKLLAESNWFKNVPTSIKRLTPNFINEACNNNLQSYSIEYLYSMPLNELAVHCKLPVSSWKSIVNSCKEYFSEAVETELPATEELLGQRYKLLHEKTYKRIRKFESQAPINFTQPVFFNGFKLISVEEIIKKVVVDALSVQPIFCVIHGDFCFSNIIYDNRSKLIKLIDPRGIAEDGTITIYGDLLYDLAKFYHSAIGFYDFIVSGNYKLDMKGQNINFSINVSEDIQLLRSLIDKEKLVKEYSESDVLPYVIILFFSMLPLHEEDYERQCALLANALRLYVIYKAIKQ